MLNAFFVFDRKNRHKYQKNLQIHRRCS